MATDPMTVSRPGGYTLSARLDRPKGPTRAYAVFAHCFTCGKDSAAAVRVSRALAARGIATMRFDFTGLGASGGDFSGSTFSSNLDDLVAAAGALREAYGAPSLLIGHSLGGAAVLAAAERLPEIRAIATIGAPADVGHVLHQFAPALDAIAEQGSAEVKLGQRIFNIRQEFVRDTLEQPQLARIANLRRALLVLHAPADTVVGIENAQQIFIAAKHPKSFVTLDTADHFLTRLEDADYAAAVITQWAERYLPPGEVVQPGPPPPPGTARIRETRAGKLQNRIEVGAHRLIADEPVEFGGDDTGPNPYDLLAASLGACTAMTLRLYAERKGWPLERIGVEIRHDKIHAADCAECETREGRIDRFEVALRLEGALDAAQRQRLAEIAARCPVHRTLHGEVVTRIVLAE